VSVSRAWLPALLLALFGTAGGGTEAADYWVASEAGNAADGSRAAPWGGLQQALDRLRPGDRLHLLPGIYRQAVKLNRSGSEQAPIEIIGEVGAELRGTRAASSDEDPLLALDGVSHLRLRNLALRDGKLGIRVAAGAHHIELHGLRSDGTDFPLWIEDASEIELVGLVASNSWNGIRVTGDSHRLRFRDLRIFFSKDNYECLNVDYWNGDGMILEESAHDVEIADLVSGYHWDAGIDIKASRVRLENLVALGNKNGLKLWGEDIQVRNALIAGSIAQTKTGGRSEGIGVKLLRGSAALSRVTLADNQGAQLDLFAGTRLTLRDSILSHVGADGALLSGEGAGTGALQAQGNLWFQPGVLAPALPAGELWRQPRFQDRCFYRLEPTSPGQGLGFDAGWLGGGSGAASPAAVCPLRGPTGQGFEPEPEERLQGLDEDQQVAGNIRVQWWPDPGYAVEEVRFFIDGKRVSRARNGPHLLGGAEGFDTRRLWDGSHWLAVVTVYRDQKMQAFFRRFRVANDRPLADLLLQPGSEDGRFDAAALRIDARRLQEVGAKLLAEPGQRTCRQTPLRALEVVYRIADRPYRVDREPFALADAEGWDGAGLAAGRHAVEGLLHTSWRTQIPFRGWLEVTPPASPSNGTAGDR
jgi:hypothetical protein